MAVLSFFIKVLYYLLIFGRTNIFLSIFRSYWIFFLFILTNELYNRLSNAQCKINVLGSMHRANILIQERTNFVLNDSLWGYLRCLREGEWSFTCTVYFSWKGFFRGIFSQEGLRLAVQSQVTSNPGPCADPASIPPIEYNYISSPVLMFFC